MSSSDRQIGFWAFMVVLVNASTVILPSAFKWLGLAAISLFVMCGIAAWGLTMGGQETVSILGLVVDMPGSEGSTSGTSPGILMSLLTFVARYSGWGIAVAFAGLYVRAEHTRRKTILRFAPVMKLLEMQDNKHREGSGLGPEGDTNKEDTQ